MHADHEMRAALALAPDAKLGRIVGVLDSLADRHVADALLSEARPRLRDIRPPRPLRFTRLLAVPLEDALVPHAAWTGAPGEVPRSALAPISDAVGAALGLMAEDIEAASLGHTMADEALVARLGARLWPVAARARLPAVPPGWEAAGLPVASASPILAFCRARWRQGQPAGGRPGG